MIFRARCVCVCVCCTQCSCVWCRVRHGELPQFTCDHAQWCVAWVTVTGLVIVDLIVTDTFQNLTGQAACLPCPTGEWGTIKLHGTCHLAPVIPVALVHQGVGLARHIPKQLSPVLFVPTTRLTHADTCTAPPTDCAQARLNLARGRHFAPVTLAWPQLPALWRRTPCSMAGATGPALRTTLRPAHRACRRAPPATPMAVASAPWWTLW